MAKRKVRFNRVSVASMAELRDVVRDRLDVTAIPARDAFRSWEFVATEQVSDETRALLRSREGGLAWLHVDATHAAYDATRITDDEARALWPRLVLQFTEDERATLLRRLEPGESFHAALHAALGTSRVGRSVMLSDQSDRDGTVLRRCLVRHGGLVAAWTRDSDTIVRAELTTGDDAWAIVRGFIDP